METHRVHEFDRAVVGIGSHIEASILTTLRILKFQRPQIWAKAISEPHAEILGQLGIEHVIAVWPLHCAYTRPTLLENVWCGVSG